jgi:hypothetical protein
MPPKAFLAKPFDQIREAGLTELVGKDEQVDQNDYGGSVAVSIADNGQPVSGEILSFVFYSTEEGSGSVQTPDGVLLILDADPATSAGDTSITAAEHQTVLGKVDLETADWHTDANGGVAMIHDVPVPFHHLTNLYLLWFHENATGLNDGAGDDEVLEVNFWYRRDS